MQTQLHEIELEAALLRDDDLAVERGVRRKPLAQRAELWKVAKQRPSVAAPQAELAAIVFEDATEAVPLRLVPDVRSAGNVVDEQRLLRREGNVRACRGDDLVGRQ